MVTRGEETIASPQLPTVRLQEKTLAELGIPDGGEFAVESVAHDADSMPGRLAGTDAVLRISPPNERGEGGVEQFVFVPGHRLNIGDRVKLEAEKRHIYVPYELFSEFGLSDEQPFTVQEDPEDPNAKLFHDKGVHIVLTKEGAAPKKLYLRELNMPRGSFSAGDILRVKK